MSTVCSTLKLLGLFINWLGFSEFLDYILELDLELEYCAFYHFAFCTDSRVVKDIKFSIYIIKIVIWEKLKT
jgi:hypothetical protein